MALQTRSSLADKLRRFLRILSRRQSRGNELYFHSPCFDGIASAVITLDFLEQRLGWSAVRLFAVNYSAKSSWLSQHLAENAAVVDFLYHPDADFWADHHGTTFLDGVQRPSEQENDTIVMFDPTAPSCALLIQQRLEQQHQYHNREYDSLVSWATKIDSARYDSVDEAIFGDAPALRLNAALQAANREFAVWLVEGLRRESMDALAASENVERWFARGRSLLRSGLERFRECADIDDAGIVTFDFARVDAMPNRYAPYYFFRDALYSVGLVRSGDKVTITAMRNPWREFESINLGQLFQLHGGGGHQRVASLVLHGPNAYESALGIRNDVVEALHESSTHREPVSSARAL